MFPESGRTKLDVAAHYLAVEEPTLAARTRREFDADELQAIR